MVLAALDACTHETHVERDVPQADPPSDYAVYVVAIDSLVVRPNRLRALTILSPTVGDGPEGPASVEAMRDDADIPADVRADFMEKNRARVPLHPERLRLAVPITVVSRDSLLAAAESGTRRQRDTPPDPLSRHRDYVNLSRVGFSRDSSRAVMYLGHSCGALCGTGWKVQLRRDLGRAWRIVAADIVWMS